MKMVNYKLNAKKSMNSFMNSFTSIFRGKKYSMNPNNKHCPKCQKINKDNPH